MHTSTPSPEQSSVAEPPSAVPVAGFRTLLVSAGLVLVAAFLVGYGADRSGDANLDDRFRQQMIFAGPLYGFFSAMVWWTSIEWRGVVRWVVVAALGLIIAAWFSFRHDQPWPRYASLLAGLALSQSLMFRWAGVPAWRRVRMGIKQQGSSDKVVANEPSGSGQFLLVDLMAMTAAVAVLIAAGQIYRADPNALPKLMAVESAETLDKSPSESWQTYWGGVLMIWIWLPCLSLLLAKLACSTGWNSGILYCVGTLLLAALGVLGISWMQQHWMVAKTPLQVLPLQGVIVGDYGTFTAMYVYLFGGFAMAGRWDAMSRSADASP